MKDQAGIIAQDGFTMIEVMVSMLILAIGILGVSLMQVSSMSGTLTMQNLTQSSNWAADQVEYYMGLPYTADELDTGTTTVVSPDGLSTMVVVVGPEIDTGGNGNDSRLITITVTYDSRGTQRIANGVDVNGDGAVDAADGTNTFEFLRSKV